MLYDTTYVWNLKNCNELVNKMKSQTHRFREQTSGYHRERVWRRGNRGVGY